MIQLWIIITFILYRITPGKEKNLIIALQEEKCQKSHLQATPW